MFSDFRFKHAEAGIKYLTLPLPFLKTWQRRRNEKYFDPSGILGDNI